MPNVTRTRGKKSKKSKKGTKRKNGAVRVATHDLNGGWTVPMGGGVKTKTTSSAVRKTAAPHVHAAHTKQTCSISNPFCPGAKGAKYPDGLNGSSMPFQIRGHTQLTGASGISGAPAGGNIVVLNPHATYGILPAASYSAGSWTMASTMTQYSNVGLLTSYAQTARVVSFGAIIRCISSVTNSQGYMVLGTSAPVGVSSGIVSNSSQYANQEEIPVYAGMEHCWISKPMGAESRTFQGMNTSSDNWLNNFDALTIELIGGNSSGTPTTLDIEYFMNVEFSLGASSGLAQVVPKDPTKNPVSTSAASTVHSTIGSFVKGGVTEAEKAINLVAPRAVADVLDGGLGFLSSIF
jgi:hypothetical protein